MAQLQSARNMGKITVEDTDNDKARQKIIKFLRRKMICEGISPAQLEDYLNLLGKISEVRSNDERGRVIEFLGKIRHHFARTLLIDSDYKGTGLEAATFGLLEKPPSVEYYDRLFENYNVRNDVGQYIAEKDIQWAGTGTYNPPPFWHKGAIWLDVMLVSPDQSVRSMFAQSERLLHGVQLPTSVYCATMNEILDRLKRNTDASSVPMQYERLVFDLSPGVDEYTEALYDLLWDRKREDNSKLDLYLVTTLDNAHVRATLKYLERLQNKADRNLEGYDNVIVVVNDLPLGMGDSALQSDPPTTVREKTFAALWEEIRRKYRKVRLVRMDAMRGWASGQTYGNMLAFAEMEAVEDPIRQFEVRQIRAANETKLFEALMDDRLLLEYDGSRDEVPLKVNGVGL